jgi:hypothetical protein
MNSSRTGKEITPNNLALREIEAVMPRASSGGSCGRVKMIKNPCAKKGKGKKKGGKRNAACPPAKKSVHGKHSVKSDPSKKKSGVKSKTTTKKGKKGKKGGKRDEEDTVLEQDLKIRAVDTIPERDLEARIVHPLVGQGDIKAFQWEADDIVYSPGFAGCSALVMYNEGAIVFTHIDPDQEKTLLAHLNQVAAEAMQNGVTGARVVMRAYLHQYALNNVRPTIEAFFQAKRMQVHFTIYNANSLDDSLDLILDRGNYPPTITWAHHAASLSWPVKRMEIGCSSFDRKCRFSKRS